MLHVRMWCIDCTASIWRPFQVVPPEFYKQTATLLLIRRFTDETPLTNIPPEILMLIFAHLPVPDIVPRKRATVQRPTHYVSPQELKRKCTMC
jgi:hypothetical protein